MRSIEEVLRDARKVGVKCSKRTFWKYRSLKLLPTGEKVSGRGNVAYFPDDTYLDLWVIQLLKDEGYGLDWVYPHVLMKKKRHVWSNLKEKLKGLKPKALNDLKETVMSTILYSLAQKVIPTEHGNILLMSKMVEMVFLCPHCNQEFSITEDDLTGTSIPCKLCKEPVQVIRISGKSQAETEIA